MTYKISWDLARWYKGLDDPAIERDVKKLEALCRAFNKKWRVKIKALAKPGVLLKALAEYERVWPVVAAGKPVAYLEYVRTLDSANTVAEALETKLSLRLQKARGELLFFGLALSNLPLATRRALLKAKVLTPFRRYLEELFAWAPHRLTESEEKIVMQKSLPAHSLWVDSVEKLVSQQVVEFEGATLPLAEAHEKITVLPTPERRALYSRIIDVYTNLAPVAEAELNAIVTNRKIDDELHHFAKPESETLLSYETDTKTLAALVGAVQESNSIAHRFYELKRKLLDVPHLTNADRAATIGTIEKKIDFNEAVQLFRRAVGKIHPKFEQIFERMLVEGQIDVYPKRGKRGGAFCSSSYGLPTMVMLNHADTLSSYRTLAHEMGHAFHGELSKIQPPFYQNYPISLAEVASTLFENFAAEEVFPLLSPADQKIYLHNRVNESVGTVFRQIACFTYEQELHRAVRERGFVPKDELAAMLNRHMGAYLGPAFQHAPADGNFFVGWSHLRYFFYTYSYAYGELISQALYARFKADASFWPEIERFLSAGSSLAPRALWRSLGIDTTSPAFWREGLARIDAELKELEQLS